MSTCSNVSRTNSVPSPELEGSCVGPGPSASPLLPSPIATGDDMMTSLAILLMKAKHEDRIASDNQRLVAENAQQRAEQTKIDKMRELAKDTFAQGLVEGVLEAASAAACAASAVDEFSSATAVKAPNNELTLESRKLARDGKLLDAGSKALTATSRLGSGFARAGQEEDRRDMAIADRDVERAKSSVDAASTASRRADDDIRETLNAIRQYLAAKTQLANAAIIKG